MTICEFLHCSFSELDSRCSSMADRMMILKYIVLKGQKEEYAVRQAQRG